MTTLRVQLTARLRALLQRRTIQIASGLLLAGGLVLTRLPLFETPGFELSAAMTIAIAVFGGIAGVNAARLERSILAGVTVPHATPPLSADQALRLPFLTATLLSLILLVPPFLGAVLGSLLGSRCSPWNGAGFYLVLPLPSALLAAIAGVLIGLWTRRSWTAALAYFGLLLATLATSLSPLYLGPQVFVLNHFLGYAPGPLYDEALRVDARILAFRALSLVYLALAIVWGGALVELPGATLRRRPLPVKRQAAIASLFVVLTLFTLYDFELGLNTRTSDLNRVLGGSSETAHFFLHFPRTKPKEDVARLERDLEFKYAEVVAFFGAAPEGKIHAYFHKSPEEKQWLVGASHTNFAKPWRNEFHVQDEGFPHPISRHEMAHVIAGAFGSPLLAVSARALFVVNVGIVEGLATAADNRADELTLHEWSGAMRKLKLAPDVRRIVGPAGFYAEAAWRAYTVAGSFLRWLEETRGAGKLRKLYPAGDFQAAYGVSLDALVSEWETFVDALKLDERSLHAAQVRFERPGIFGRPCAHEVAKLREEAGRMKKADPELALRLYRRCSEIEPENINHLRDQAEVLEQQRDLAGSQALMEQVLARKELPSANRAQALMGLGDLAWEAGNDALARERFAEVLSLHRDRGTDRVAAVKLEAIADPEASPVLRRYFLKSQDLPEVLLLKDLAVAKPKYATVRYLIGRQLLLRRDHAGAARYFKEARGLGLPDEQVRHENLRVLAESLYYLGDCAGVREALAELVKGGTDADRAYQEEWGGRCDFEEKTYGALLADPK